MKKTRKIIKLFFMSFAICSFFNIYSQNEVEIIKIGIISDYEGARNWSATVLTKETNTLVGSKFNVQFPDDKIVTGKYDFNLLKEYVHQFLADDNLDIIIGVGSLVSEILTKNGPYEKPVIASGVFHPGYQNIPITSSNSSGVRNLGYTIAPLSMERDLEAFYSIYPFRHLGFLIFEGYVNDLDGFSEYFYSCMEKYDAAAKIIPVGKDVRTALENLPANLDALYIGLLYEYTSIDEYQDLISQLNSTKLPTFAMIGRPYVELGVLAGVAPGDILENLSRRIALDIEKILDGQDPGNFPVNIKFKDELVINMRTAREIDFFPSFVTLSQADVLFEEDLEHARTINFLGLITELLENNLNLRVANQEVIAGSNEIDKARSYLLPQVNLSASNVTIDETRAEGSFGMNPQNSTLGSGEFSQVLFSESAHANLTIQKILQESRHHEFNQQELDLVLEASKAYINILKAQTYERIIREDLNLTRKHLDIARLRQEVGFSDASDVYRWESEIERVSIQVIIATAQKRAANIALNEILNRPLDEIFIAEDLTWNDPFITDENFSNLVSNTRTWKFFIDFMVNESLARSPELKQLDSYIEVQERLILSNRRSRYLPTVGVQTQGDYILSRHGAGTDPMEPIIIPGMAPITIGADLKNYQWNLGIRASIPIFEGGHKNAEIQQSETEILILRDQRDDLANKISQRSRTSFEFLGASSPALPMAARASEAAYKSLELSQDAYRKGLISIVDLIDVQQAAAQSKLLEANSVYDYLIDYLEVSRATGIFLFLLNIDEKMDLMSRLLQYMAINAPDELMK